MIYDININNIKEYYEKNGYNETLIFIENYKLNKKTDIYLNKEIKNIDENFNDLNLKINFLIRELNFLVPENFINLNINEILNLNLNISKTERILKLKETIFFDNLYKKIDKDNLKILLADFRNNFDRVPFSDDFKNDNLFKKYNLNISNDELYYFFYPKILFGLSIENNNIFLRDKPENWKNYGLSEIFFLESFIKLNPTFKKIKEFPEEMIKKVYQLKTAEYLMLNEEEKNNNDLFKSEKNIQTFKYLFDFKNNNSGEVNEIIITIKNYINNLWLKDVQNFKIIKQLENKNNLIYNLIKEKNILNINLLDYLLDIKKEKIINNSIKIPANMIESIIYNLVKNLKNNKILKNKDIEQEYYNIINNDDIFKIYQPLTNNEIDIIIKDVTNIINISNNKFKNWNIIHLEEYQKNQKGFDYIICNDNNNKFTNVKNKNNDDILFSYKWKKGYEFANLSRNDLNLKKLEIKSETKKMILSIDDFVINNSKLMDLFQIRKNNSNVDDFIDFIKNDISDIDEIMKLMYSVDNILEKDNNLDNIKKHNFLFSSINEDGKNKFSSNHVNYIIKNFYLEENGLGKKNIQDYIEENTNLILNKEKWDKKIFNYIQSFYTNSLIDFSKNININNKEKLIFLKKIYHMDISNNNDSYLIENGKTIKFLNENLFKENINNIKILINNIKSTTGSLIFDICIEKNNDIITIFKKSSLRYKQRKFVGALSFNISNEVEWGKEFLNSNLKNENNLNLII